MTNKEKLEIIDRVLDVCYKTINLNIDNNKLIPKNLTTNFKDITQAIYNLESTKLLLENEIDFNAEFNAENEETFVYDENMLKGKCFKKM